MPVAFVTGAVKGIGLAIAVRLADDGFDVAVNDLESEDLQSVVSSIKAKGRKAIAVPFNVCSAQAVEAAVQKTVTELGGLDVMVANAGVIAFHPFLELTEETFDRCFAINFKGVFHCFQSAAKHMIKQGRGGRLIAASSIVGKKGYPLLADYSASKFAIRGLTQSVAAEMGKHGITVNCYCPGHIDTQMIHDETTGKLRDYVTGLVAGLPIARLGLPTDVANLVSFLASEQSSFITGQSLSVDGGDYLT